MAIVGQLQSCLETAQEAKRETCEDGETVKRLRLQLRVTRGELAAATGGISVGTIKNLESGLNVRREHQIGLLQALLSIARARLASGAVTLPKWFSVAREKWDPEWSGPAALLRAEFEIVPFHGETRNAELCSLLDWCQEPSPTGVKLLHGPGGIGKTRLARELCNQLRTGRNPWHAGFVDIRRYDRAENPWTCFPPEPYPILVVIDYAGDREKEELLASLLANIRSAGAAKVRLLLLDRDDLWLGRLMGVPTVREILLSPRLQGVKPSIGLQRFAPKESERNASWQVAAKAFGKKLGRAPGSPTTTLSQPAFEEILTLHTAALLATIGEQTGGDANAILKCLLAREKEYWRRMVIRRGLPESLLSGVEEAVFWISQEGGAHSVESAVKLLGKCPLLADQERIVLHNVAALLRACYPSGEHGIGPLQPDLLQEYFQSERMRPVPSRAKSRRRRS